MNNYSSSLIQRLFTSVPRSKFTLHVTGGGCQAVSWLLTTAGASQCVMEAMVPYSRSSLKSCIGTVDASFCSEETACLMAEAARRRTIDLMCTEENPVSLLTSSNLFGVSCTAALVSTTPKRGAHRCYVGISSLNSCKVYQLDLNKSLNRSRLEEDAIASQLILYAMEECSGASTSSVSSFIDSTENIIEHVKPSGIAKSLSSSSVVMEALSSLYNDAAASSSCNASLTTSQNSTLAKLNFLPKVTDGDAPSISPGVVLDNMSLPKGTFIYPGSYNPLHIGHIELADKAIQRYCARHKVPDSDKRLLVFEISATNADKPPIPTNVIASRLQQFIGTHESTDDNTAVSTLLDPLLHHTSSHYAGVCITNAPLFTMKAKLFPGCVFIIGTDTMSRLLNPKYYNNKVGEMIAQLSDIASLGCSFVVGGRVVGASKPDDNTNSAASQTAVFETAAIVWASIELDIPTNIKDMFMELSEEDFRIDLSSSELRKKLKC